MTLLFYLFIYIYLHVISYILSIFLLFILNLELFFIKFNIFVINIPSIDYKTK
jgi:hypothetical protein